MQSLDHFPSLSLLLWNVNNQVREDAQDDIAGREEQRDRLRSGTTGLRLVVERGCHGKRGATGGLVFRPGGATGAFMGARRQTDAFGFLRGFLPAYFCRFSGLVCLLYICVPT